MKTVQIGTVLIQNDDTTIIYEKFPDYFSVDENDSIFVEYIIVKEPSLELINEITKYYEKVKEANRERNEYVDKIANIVLKKLNEKDKEYIFLHPDPTTHHFGLGLAIRNQYIYNDKYNSPDCEPDSLSSDIVSRIASLIIEDYDYENSFYRFLYDNSSFNYMRILYYTLTGNYPNDIMKKYADLPDEFAAYKKVMDIVRSTILDVQRVKELCKLYSISDKRYNEFCTYVKEYNKNNWRIIPYDLILLSGKRLDYKYREKLIGLLKPILNESPRLAIEMPSYVFNQKDAVLLAVSAYGAALKRFRRYNADDDVITAAIKNNGEAIQYVKKELRNKQKYIRLALSSKYGNALKMRCMKEYRDDEKYVRLALKVNGCNIKYASKRLKDDKEIAKYAVVHQNDFCPEDTISNLSARLRDDIEIALLDIKKGNGCVSSYSHRLRDNDEVAKALLDSEHKWKLYMMSKQIQKKYE